MSDCGVDTTILDDSWSMTTLSKAPRVENPVRYNPTLGTSYGLPVFDTIAMTIVQSGQHIIIRIQVEVYNSNTRYTLFSKFQIRNSATVIDSIANSHRFIHDALYDTQSRYYDTNNSNDWLNFYVLNA